MREYIDREALVIDLDRRHDFLEEMHGGCDQYTTGFLEAVLRVENFWAADVAPVRRGQWMRGDDYDIGDVCSECFWDSQTAQPSYRYCPWCGAQMGAG